MYMRANTAKASASTKPFWTAGIPKLFERDGEACFTHVDVVDRQPPTSDLHLCFCARSKAEVDAFHAAGMDAGFRSSGAPGYRNYGQGYYAAYLLDP